MISVSFRAPLGRDKVKASGRAYSIETVRYASRNVFCRGRRDDLGSSVHSRFPNWDGVEPLPPPRIIRFFHTQRATTITRGLYVKLSPLSTRRFASLSPLFTFPKLSGLYTPRRARSIGNMHLSEGGKVAEVLYVPSTLDFFYGSTHVFVTPKARSQSDWDLPQFTVCLRILVHFKALTIS